jgi:hypothetical protein
MDIDYYFNNWLETSSDYCIEQDLQSLKYIESLINDNEQDFFRIISFRKNLITLDEKSFFSTHLQCFPNLGHEDRITCFTICAELSDLIIKKSWRLRCEKYSPTQALFKFEPSLLNFLRQKSNGKIDFELINSSKFEQLRQSEILGFNNRKAFAYLDFALNPILLSWVKETFSQKEFYIRVNPHKIFTDIPERRDFEFKLIPANPHWWKEINIHNRTKKQSCYVLEESDDALYFWERHILRLEVIVNRDNNGHLSMMIEELTKIDSQKMVFGRCIHLDSSNIIGTNFFNVSLNHLDLAINVYEGDNAKKRLETNLAIEGKTEDASYRTHLLRIDNISFKYMLGFAAGFFESKILFKEWIEDQFQCTDFTTLINTPSE